MADQTASHSAVPAEALRQSEERFRLLVESVRDYAIFMLDPDGRVVSWNTGAERIKGYRAEEILGQHYSRFYPPEEVHAGTPARMLARAAAEGRAEAEGWRVRKDGSRFWAHVVITALRTPAGELRSFAKVTRDLTEHRQAEEAPRQRALGEERERARARFVQTAAHELRKPMAAVKGLLSLLKRRLAGGAEWADAARAGCELAMGQCSFGSVSQHNQVRAGLRVAYTKAIWRPLEGTSVP